MLILTFFLVLVCGTRAQSLSAPFSYTLYTRRAVQLKITDLSEEHVAYVFRIEE
jgi:hypothetical protein